MPFDNFLNYMFNGFFLKEGGREDREYLPNLGLWGQRYLRMDSWRYGHK